jgi:hypothetical protein
MKVRFDMRGYTNLFTNTVAIPDHNRLVVKKVCTFSINRIAHSKQSSLIFCLCTGKIPPGFGAFMPLTKLTQHGNDELLTTTYTLS